MHPFRAPRNIAVRHFSLVSPGLTPRRPDRAERKVEPPMIVYLVEEAGMVACYVLECFMVPQYTASAFNLFMKLSALALS